MSWAWYSGGWSNANGGVGEPGWTNGTAPRRANLRRARTPRAAAQWPNCPGKLFQFHHQPLNYFASFAPGKPARARHLRDEAEFLAQAAASSGAAGSRRQHRQAAGAENEHPGYASATRGSSHLVDLLQAIERSRCAADTMVIVTYDEFGGQWDHVPPPGRAASAGRRTRWARATGSPRWSSLRFCPAGARSTARRTTRPRCSPPSSALRARPADVARRSGARPVHGVPARGGRTDRRASGHVGGREHGQHPRGCSPAFSSRRSPRGTRKSPRRRGRRAPRGAGGARQPGRRSPRPGPRGGLGRPPSPGGELALEHASAPPDSSARALNVTPSRDRRSSCRRRAERHDPRLPVHASDPMRASGDVTARGLPRAGAGDPVRSHGRPIRQAPRARVDDVERLMNCIVEHAGPDEGREAERLLAMLTMLRTTAAGHGDDDRRLHPPRGTGALADRALAAIARSDKHAARAARHRPRRSRLRGRGAASATPSRAPRCSGRTSSPAGPRRA